MPSRPPVGDAEPSDFVQDLGDKPLDVQPPEPRPRQRLRGD